MPLRIRLSSSQKVWVQRWSLLSFEARKNVLCYPVCRRENSIRGVLVHALSNCDCGGRGALGLATSLGWCGTEAKCTGRVRGAISLPKWSNESLAKLLGRAVSQGNLFSVEDLAQNGSALRDPVRRSSSLTVMHLLLGSIWLLTLNFLGY